MSSEPTVRAERLYEGRVLSLRVDTVRLSNGREARREIVEHVDAVAVVPLLANGDVVLVRQFRKPAERELLEIPAGGLNPGEGPVEAAHRELQEEIGFAPGKLHHIATFYTAPGFSTERMHLFIATELSPSRLRADDDEDIAIVRMPFRRALDLAVNGAILDAKTLIGLMAARLRPGGASPEPWA